MQNDKSFRFSTRLMTAIDRTARRRHEILDAALGVFAEKGYHGAGIADIAAELNIGHGTVYRYFENKLDLFNAVLARVMGEIMVVLTREPPNTDSLPAYREQLHRIGTGLFQIFTKDPRNIRIVFFEAMTADPAVRDEVMNALDMSANLTRAYLDNGVRKGFLRAGLDTGVASRAVNAVIFEGVKQILRATDAESEARHWIGHGVTLMLEGVAAREALD